MRKYLVAAAFAAMVASPAFADEVGVHVGPVGAGVTVGETRDPVVVERERTTVVREKPATESTTVIKKEDADGTREKTVIHRDND